jgi:hypothetical protein
MSYDLIFWKEHRPMGDPRSTYDLLNQCLPADLPPNPDLEKLPLVEIYRALKIVFPGIYLSPGDAWVWSSGFRLYPEHNQKILAEYGIFPESPWPEDDRTFICYFSDSHLSFCLNYGMDRVMKAIVDVMAEFDCPVYDPQFDRRARAAKNLPATLEIMKELESHRTEPQTDQFSQNRVFDALTLELENQPVNNAPTLERLISAVDQLTPYGGPGYLLLEGDGQDYIQVAGGNGMYTVEWRVYQADESFQHWIVGLPDEPSMPFVRIVTYDRIVEVQQNEELSAKDAKVLLLAYANQKDRPAQYSWRDASSMFKP